MCPHKSLCVLAGHYGSLKVFTRPYESLSVIVGP